MRGRVYISPLASVPYGRMIEPGVARFNATWQDDDAEGLVEGVEIDGADAAVAWGRERADMVYIRLGHSDGTFFSAGSVHPPEDWPHWPPSAPPSECWWIVPDPPTLAEVRTVANAVASGECSVEDAVKWASDRTRPTFEALDDGGDVRVLEALLELTDGWDIIHGEVRRSPRFRRRTLRFRRWRPWWS